MPMRFVEDVNMPPELNDLCSQVLQEGFEPQEGNYFGTLPSSITNATAVLASTENTQNYLITGTLVINKNVSFVNCRFYMSPGAKIIVKNGYTLKVNSSRFFGCDKLWEGIRVENGSTLIMTASRIEDAFYAIRSKQFTPPPPQTFIKTATINLTKDTFNRNHVSVVKLKDDPDFVVTYFRGCIFDHSGADLALPPTGIDFPFFTNNILSRYCTKKSYAGVLLDGSFASFNVNTSYKCSMRRMRHGFVTRNSSIKIKYFDFCGMKNYDGGSGGVSACVPLGVDATDPEYNACGSGIFATAGHTTVSKSPFWANGGGGVTQYEGSLTALENLFDDSGEGIAVAYLVYGDLGIGTSFDLPTTCNVSNNTFDFVSSKGGGMLIDRPKNTQGNVGLQLNNNIFKFGAGVGEGFAIWVKSYYANTDKASIVGNNILVNNALFGKIPTNDIFNPYYTIGAIHVSGEGFLNSSKNWNICQNIIKFSADNNIPTLGTQKGIEIEGLSSSNSRIYDNTITGGTLDNFSAGIGIVRTSGFCYDNNTTAFSGMGLNMKGSCYPSTIEVNKFKDHYVGSLFNAEYGPGGTISSPIQIGVQEHRGNQWIGPFGALGAVLADAATSDLNQFIVDQADNPYYNPTNSGPPNFFVDQSYTGLINECKPKSFIGLTDSAIIQGVDLNPNVPHWSFYEKMILLYRIKSDPDYQTSYTLGYLNSMLNTEEEKFADFAHQFLLGLEPDSTLAKELQDIGSQQDILLQQADSLSYIQAQFYDLNDYFDVIDMASIDSILTFAQLKADSMEVIVAKLTTERQDHISAMRTLHSGLPQSTLFTTLLKKILLHDLNYLDGISRNLDVIQQELLGIATSDVNVVGPLGSLAGARLTGCYKGAYRTQWEIWQGQSGNSPQNLQVAAKQSIVLMPNPTRDRATASFNGFEAKQIALTNAMGKVLLIHSFDLPVISFEFDMADLPTGIYFVVASNQEGKQYSSRLVVLK
jgi:hypothetical protein